MGIGLLTLPAKLTSRLNVTARVKIAQGCQGSCSYCVVKLIKGPIKSRSVEVIAKDVEHMIQHGAKQIFLTAQDGGAYGLDLSLIHISEPTRQAEISYAVFCLKKKKKK